MPILKLIRYKSGTDFRPSVMRNVMEYCLQPSKTKIREEIFSVTGQNCVPAIAYNQFMATKASWGKRTDFFSATMCNPFRRTKILLRCRQTKLPENLPQKPGRAMKF